MSEPPRLKTYSSHRNKSRAPSSWTPPFLVIEPESLPDFPCLSPTGRIRALSHKTLVNVVSVDIQDPIRPLKQELASHKRMELMGDAFLRFGLYRLLFQRHPELTAAGVTEVSHNLLDNTSLSWLSWHYGFFDDELLQHAQRVPTFIYNSQTPAADLFEAWLGTVSYEWAVDDTIEWLDKLFSSKVFRGLDERVEGVRKREHDRVANRKVNHFRSSLGAEPGERSKKRQRPEESGSDRGGRGFSFQH
ncbi:uncharacterized protein JCM6883_005436 [Sporobolomyces salmoneus]|uniref:uncharacterized protein n=1 Tax=Sporobolomyces salmoneus TaxID=183962 RepID=UPI00317D126B